LTAAVLKQLTKPGLSKSLSLNVRGAFSTNFSMYRKRNRPQSDSFSCRGTCKQIHIDDTHQAWLTDSNSVVNKWHYKTCIELSLKLNRKNRLYLELCYIGQTSNSLHNEASGMVQLKALVMSKGKGRLKTADTMLWKACHQYRAWVYGNCQATFLGHIIKDNCKDSFTQHLSF
jgi:hypothetical protein